MSVEVKNITKYYGEQPALQDVSFSLKKGEITGFLGPNGAGKSTMMKILTGYIPASSGSAIVNGFEIGRENLKIKQQTGYLPEHNPLYPDMYVREYLHYNAAIYKVPKSEAEQALIKTGLLPEVHKKIGQLSKGYRQRVGLAAAILHNPEILILDEPTTGLDPNQLIEIRELIKNLGKEKTVLLSTHIMQEVEAVCDRVIIINHGKIVLDSYLEDLRKNEEQIVEVEFDYRIETVALQKLPHLNKVDNPGGFVYHLYFSTEQDMRSEIFDFAHSHGVKILQMHLKNQTLENLFVRLTKNQNPV